MPKVAKNGVASVAPEKVPEPLERSPRARAPSKKNADLPTKAERKEIIHAIEPLERNAMCADVLLDPEVTPADMLPPELAKFHAGHMHTMLEAVAGGHYVTTTMEALGFRTAWPFYHYLQSFPKWVPLYNAAKAARAERFAEQTVQLADEAMQAKTSEEAAAYKLRVTARQWVASKLLPRIYGEKVAIEDGGANALVVHLVASSNDLMKKLRGASDSETDG